MPYGEEENPLVNALKNSREGTELEENPASESEDGEILYIDEMHFPENVKEGDKVLLTANVVNLGSKYGINPEEIKVIDGGGGQMEQGATGGAKQNLSDPQGI